MSHRIQLSCLLNLCISLQHKRGSLSGAARRKLESFLASFSVRGVLLFLAPRKPSLPCRLLRFIFKEMGSTLWLEKDLQSTN